MPVGARDKDDPAGDATAMAAVNEGLKEASAVRAASVTSKKGGKGQEYDLHLIPVEGENAADAWNAAEQFELQTIETEKLAAENDELENKTYQFFLKCRTPVHMIGGRRFPPIGVYFTKKPVKVVGPHDWYSSYKQREVVWAQDVVCQACLKAMNQRNRLHYEWQDTMAGLWIPDRRWVWKVPKDPARFRLEGMTRAFDLPHVAANSWREEHERKLAKVSQEGVKSNG